MTEAYIENNIESIKDMTGTYKTCFICNLVSSSVFSIFTAAEMIKHGFNSVGNFALAAFAIIFGFMAVTSYLKYRSLKAGK